eukprot:5554091-Prymnesium_polylepis.1
MRPVLLRSFGSAKSTVTTVPRWMRRVGASGRECWSGSGRLGMTWWRWCGEHVGTWTATGRRGGLGLHGAFPAHLLHAAHRLGGRDGGCGD